jgi:hypothetical protein
METQVTGWLNEGLKHYSAGDPARALEAWYRILAVEPQHAAAIEYVSFVRETVRVSVPTAEDAASTPTLAPTTPTTPTTTALTTAAAEPHDARPGSLLDNSWGDFVSDDVSPPPPREPSVEKVELTPVPPPEPETTTATPLPPPEPAGADAIEPPPPPAIARWASPRLARDHGPATPVGEFEALQPFDMDALEEPLTPLAPPPDLGLSAAAVAHTPPPPMDLGAADGEHLAVAGDTHVANEAVSPNVTPPALAAPASESAFPTPPITPLDSVSPWLVPTAPAGASVEPTFPAPHLTPIASFEPASFASVSTPNSGADASPSMALAETQERVMRQSVRFDEPRRDTQPALLMRAAPETTTVTPSTTPTTTTTSTTTTTTTTTTPSTTTPSTTTMMDQDRIETASPWDGDAGAARTLDLDVATRTSSPLDSLLRSPAAQTTKPPIREGEPADDLTALMTGARELFDLGDFSGSLELVEKALRSNPDHEDARAYLKRNEATLLHMYQSKIGNMGTIPRQLVPPDEIIWLNMHHRAGFILSQVDGTLAYEDLLDISGMDRFDTMRILADLVQNRIIG